MQSAQEHFDKSTTRAAIRDWMRADSMPREARQKGSGAQMVTRSELLEKDVPPMLVAGIRTKGRYSDCGKLFGKVCRGAGRAADGKPMMLHYDAEYKETDADFEACVPLKARKEIAGAVVHELPAAHCVSMIHHGAYEWIGDTYEKLMAYVNNRGYHAAGPAREIYVKGPGLIFRGNPRKYVTEIQLPIEKNHGAETS